MNSRTSRMAVACARLAASALGLCLPFLLAVTASAQTAAVPLYSGTVPNSKPAPAGYAEKNSNGWVTGVTVPELTPYLPAAGKATGQAIIVIPGGAYFGLALNHEGADVARKLSENGIAAFLLKYRLPSDKIMADRAIGPLQDAQRAIQLIRERAAEWGVNPSKVGVIGFSAGGHLASTLGTHFDSPVIANPGQVNLRPDFMALIYPVITMGSETHAGSRENLIGAVPAATIEERYSSDRQVTAATPPVFIVHSQDDSVVSVQNALLMYQAAVKNKVQTEMHLYPTGNHGYGLNNRTVNDMWFERLLNWLRRTP
jgi:acetyl esterase/lipase